MPIQSSGGTVGGVALDTTLAALSAKVVAADTAHTVITGALPAGTAVIGHAIIDSAGAVTVTGLPALPAGANVIGHVLVDSASAVTVSTLPSLPAGSAVIGHVIVDSSGLPSGASTESTLTTVSGFLSTLAATVSGGKLLTTETSAAAAAASDATTATKTTAILTALGGLPAALGPAAAASALVVTMATPNEFNQATIAATGAQIVSAAARIYLLHAINTGIAAIFLYLFNATAAVATGGLSVFESTTLAVAGGLQNAFGTLGIYCSSGARIDASATGGATGYTQSVGTTTVKTSISYV